MRFSLSRWFRAETQSCLLCGKQAESASLSAHIPIRRQEARQILQQLCPGCLHSIPWITTPMCRICGRPEACPDCPRRSDRHVAFCRSAVRYDKAMKDLLALYKYRGSERLEPLMAAMLAAAFERILLETPRDPRNTPELDVITSVPLAEERLDERGFNQAERMAQTLAAWYGINYRPLLQRVRHTEKQSLKNRRSRLSDMKGNFVAAAGQPADFPYHRPVRILLVDDIYTTGSTINECARAVQQVFASTGTEIYGALWARS